MVPHLNTGIPDLLSDFIRTEKELGGEYSASSPPKCLLHAISPGDVLWSLAGCCRRKEVIWFYPCVWVAGAVLNNYVDPFWFSAVRFPRQVGSWPLVCLGMAADGWQMWWLDLSDDTPVIWQGGSCNCIINPPEGRDAIFCWSFYVYYWDWTTISICRARGSDFYYKLEAFFSLFGLAAGNSRTNLANAFWHGRNWAGRAFFDIQLFCRRCALFTQ